MLRTTFKVINLCGQKTQNVNAPKNVLVVSIIHIINDQLLNIAICDTKILAVGKNVTILYTFFTFFLLVDIESTYFKHHNDETKKSYMRTLLIITQ